MYEFVSDRYRAIRTDFSCQGLEGPSSMAAHEQMVRFHALCVYRMLPHTSDGVHSLVGAGGRVSRNGHLPGAEGGIWANNGAPESQVQLADEGDACELTVYIYLFGIQVSIILFGSGVFLFASVHDPFH